ncbi:MAG: MBL fold metallo-hydrolase [Deltaproteobacteria bacterium]|nr:MBL fold metallo-hydrolase [Deltaproteobacteria bacterium]MBI3386151.1 MBL fold metallo-hydrolase [Deltaproteobacteria bacterium]
MISNSAADSDRTFGRVTVLVGDKNGKYPHGNSILVRGRDTSLLIDPSLTVAQRADQLRGAADLVVLSHVHEDHVAGVFAFPDAPIYAHRADASGLRSMDGLMEIYGYGEPLTAGMRDYVTQTFHYTPRPDTLDYDDGAEFDLGGTRVRAVHLPGHTRGHNALLIEPEGVLFLGDIDLTGFGPYYGDAWSDLNDFERSLVRLPEIDARIWVSFHHVGIIEDRDVFTTKLAAFAAKIPAREQAILDFLAESRSLNELVAHRFLYPPHAHAPFIDAVEQRTIAQHLTRLIANGAVIAGDGGRFLRRD